MIWRIYGLPRGCWGAEHSSVINGGTRRDRVARLRRSRGSRGTQIEMNSSWLCTTVKWLCKRHVTVDEQYLQRKSLSIHPCPAHGYFQGEDWEGGNRKRDRKKIKRCFKESADIPFFFLNEQQGGKWHKRKQEAKNTRTLFHCFRLSSTPERQLCGSVGTLIVFMANEAWNLLSENTASSMYSRRLSSLQVVSRS